MARTTPGPHLTSLADEAVSVGWMQSLAGRRKDPSSNGIEAMTPYFGSQFADHYATGLNILFYNFANLLFLS